MGAVSKLFRSIQEQLGNLGEKLSPGKREEDPDVVRVPRSWVKGRTLEQEVARKPRSRMAQRQQTVELEPIVVDNKRHVPGLRTVKRGLAAVLLIFNLIFSQYLIYQGAGGVLPGLLFVGNSFVLADYLWKTRRTTQ